MMLHLRLCGFGKFLVVLAGLTCVFNLHAGQIVSIDGKITIDVKSQKINIEQTNQNSYIKDIPGNGIKCVVFPRSEKREIKEIVKSISNAFNVSNSSFVHYVFPGKKPKSDSLVYFKCIDTCSLIIFSTVVQNNNLWFGIHSDDPLLGHFDLQKIMASILHSEIEISSANWIEPEHGNGLPLEIVCLSVSIKDRLLKEDILLNLDSELEEAFISRYKLDHPGSPAMQFVRKYGIESPYAAALFYAIRYQVELKNKIIEDKKIARMVLEWQFKSY